MLGVQHRKKLADRNTLSTIIQGDNDSKDDIYIVLHLSHSSKKKKIAMSSKAIGLDYSLRDH